MTNQRHNPRVRAVVATRTTGMDQHLLGAAVIALALLAALATLAA